MRSTTRPGVRRWLTAAALAAATVLTVTSCGSPDGGKDDQARELLPPSAVDTSDGLRIDGELVADKQLYDAAKNDTVILYSGTGKEAEDLTAARFMQETGIKIELTRLPTNKLAERALSEHGAGQLPAEIIRVTDPRVAREFEKQNVFVPYQTPFHDLLVQQNTGVRDTFVNCYYFVNAMGYNSAMIEDDQPTKWEDLTDPRYSGKLGVVSVTTGGTLNALAHFQIETLGEDFLKAQGAQNPRIFDSTSTEVDALARGEIAIGSLSFNNAFAAQLAGAPIKLVIPDKGVSGSENLMGMTAKGVQSPAAKVFMNWTMSKSGQSFAAAQGFVPARTDIGPVKAGEYQLPQANSPQFHLFTEEQFAQYAVRDEEMWKKAFNYMG
ncbi:ABC transporter substrate-binding protein [Rhodococcus opacus]|uniref:ABC transporter substrate-binding protein n=1 Tax=Rhodococcus opacus TaxID=37919 RepID=UPI0024BAC7FD|nr:extracellular solute-binding protein [Rhodococcus opacus]MDJ0419786.1 extracellular solute-binding protein [Rhodococcus opacus]